MKGSTPMMEQYLRLKNQHPECLLFFRLGDFYEMFFEDAEIGSRELGITLTGRDAGGGKRAPMCGVPHHSADDYIKTLIDKGYKVAICEQIEDVAQAKGLVERDVVRVITPGTYWEGADESKGSYIASVFFDGSSKRIGLCMADVSTGEVYLCSLSDLGQATEELAKFAPREIVVPDTDGNFQYSELVSSIRATLTHALPETFSSHAVIKRRSGASWTVYGQEIMDDLSLRATPEALSALCGLLTYLKDTQKTGLSHLRTPVLYMEQTYLEIDQSTRRNLELTARLQGGYQGSLAWALDKCKTTMGSRLLRRWLERPLCDALSIHQRLDSVESLVRDSVVRAGVRAALSGIRDLERLATKLAYGSCDARDLVALAASLEKVPEIKALLPDSAPHLLRRIAGDLDDVHEAVSAIRSSLVDEPPVSLTEGGLVREGFSPEVDELRDLTSGGKRWILEFEAKEREKTGIKSLKVGYNRVFGYYIEVTNSNLQGVPDHYIRKQTLATAERFITRELRDKEAQILGAQEKLYKEEYRIFAETRDAVTKELKRIQSTARALAELDVLASFAEVAYSSGYTRPEVKPHGLSLRIEGGRHPVLEKILPSGTFVPNDLDMTGDERVLIITGPNMGGKSTYCRQAALVVIMAQAGSFVPCSSCSLSLTDKVFARVGAYDDLFMGQSTFMVEMSEVSRIVRGATSRSLVILDEIGRGTSTFDGLSVAWAVVEHLADPKTGGCRTLVATHYRELTLLSDLKPGIANYHVTVKRGGDEIVFLRRVVRGVAEGSFGIDVSAMAGLPASITQRAREILSALEAEARRGSRWKAGILGQVASRSAQELDVGVPGQWSLFGPVAASISPELQGIVDEIRKLDPDSMTPLGALEAIYRLKALLNSER